MDNFPSLSIVIPAAGIGKRMQAKQAKQYLKINDKTIIEHTIERFVNLPFVSSVIVALAKDDLIFSTLNISEHAKVVTVDGGKERADSVLSGLSHAKQNNSKWVMVHDAARPCVDENDIVNLYQSCLNKDSAGILATPVRDTMKIASNIETTKQDQAPAIPTISKTTDRSNMWHALTPQCAKVSELEQAIRSQLDSSGLVNKLITDEASALELSKLPVLLVQGSVKNIKITMPEDLELAQFYLS